MAATCRSEETSDGFTACPRDVVYSPSLNCILGTVKDKYVEVLDIHSGSILAKVNVQDDENGGALYCMYCDDKDCFVVAKGQRIGCRGTLHEKLFLDSILQLEYMEGDKYNVKVELDVVQAGILINGFVECQDQIDSQNYHFTVKEKFKAVLALLQKEYDSTLQLVKDLDNKAVKWLTVCLEMECSSLYTAFHTVYSVMTCDRRGPALPIVGDVLRRLLLLQKQKNEDATSRSERTYMLGEAERLETFNMWPHMNYKYVLPGPMAEAGFYHPKSSKVSEDRAMCFSCSVCLVCWEPSDQPWSEHERHSSNCPFVKGEYTENVALNVCAGTTHGQSLRRPNDDIVCIASQECSGLIATATKTGYLTVWSTYPVLKKYFEVKIMGFASKDKGDTDRDTDDDTRILSKTPDVLDGEPLQSNTFQTQNNEPEEMGMSLFDTMVNNELYVFPFLGVPSDELNSPLGETDITTEETSSSAQSSCASQDPDEQTEITNDVASHSGAFDNDAMDSVAGNKVFKTSVNESHFKITALALANIPCKSNKSSGDEGQLISIVGVIKNGSSGSSSLGLYVHNISNFKLKEDSGNNTQSKMTKSKVSVIPEMSTGQDDPFFEIEEEFYGESDDSSAWSVIDEYLLVTQKQQVNSKQKSKDDVQEKRPESNLEDFVQAIEVPVNVQDMHSTISHILVTERHVIVVARRIASRKTPEIHCSKSNQVDREEGNLSSLSDSKEEETFKVKADIPNQESIEEAADTHKDSNKEDVLSDKSVTSDSTHEVIPLASASHDIEGSITPAEVIINGSEQPGTNYITQDLEYLHTHKDSSDEQNYHSTEHLDSNEISSYILCYSISKLAKGCYLSETPMSSRKFGFDEIVQDCVVLSHDKLSMSTITEIQGKNSAMYAKGNRFLFVGVTGKENGIFILEPFNLQTYYRVVTSISPSVSSLVKIVYCAGVEVLVACFENGQVWRRTLKGKSDEVCQSTEQESVEEVLSLLVESPLDLHKLARLNEVTTFESMFKGVHISVPMDWVVGRAAAFSNSLFNGKKYRPHVQEISPVNGPARLKTHSLSNKSDKSGGLKSTDSTVTFKVFAAADSAIGYFDLTVKCSCSITDLTDVAVTLKLANNTNSDSGSACQEDSDEALLCLPVLLSEHTGAKESVANIVLTSPKLVTMKSSYFLVEFSQLTKVSESPLGRDNDSDIDGTLHQSTSEDKVSRLCISDFITSIEISVYQFAKVPFPWSISCRTLILQNSEFHSRLLNYLCKEASPCLKWKGLSETYIAMNLLMWIAGVLENSEEFSSNDFRITVKSFIEPLLETCFIKGDRSLAHSCFEFLIMMLSQCSRIQDDSFMDDLLSASKRLFCRICECKSAAAVRWFFKLTSAIGSYAQFEQLFDQLFSLLVSASKIHRDGFTAEHMLLQSKYDVSGTPLDPILVEPGEVDLQIGEISSSAIQSNSLNENESILKNVHGQKVFSLPSCDVPGLFEVQPLGIVCSSTSDGATAEKFKCGNPKKAKSFGIPQKSSDKGDFVDYAALCDKFQMYLSKKDYTDYDVGQESLLDLSSASNNVTEVQALDTQVNHLLQIGNTNPWVQGIKVGKGKKISHRRRENCAHIEFDDKNMRNFFTVPDPMALVVKRMHALSHHFAVLDFQQTVMLTDILIPPCSSLASLSIVCWKEPGNENDAIPVASSEDIGLKALVLTDIRPPINCQFLKIIAVGTRTLNSAKVVIPLGQFHGFMAVSNQDFSVVSENVKGHFDDAFCQYSLATDRLLSLLHEDKHECLDQDLISDRVLKAYEDCSLAQIQLNSVVYHINKIRSNREFIDLRLGPHASDREELATAERSVIRGTLEQGASGKDHWSMLSRNKVSQDFLRVIIECCLETLLLLIIDADPVKEQTLNKDTCCELFQSICIYGSTKTRQQGCLLLQCLCGGADWWGEFLVTSFKLCYEDKHTSPMPRERLFPCFVRLIQNSQNLPSVYQSFLELLAEYIEPLIATRQNRGQRNLKKSSFLDWILLMLNELLQGSSSCSADWAFLIPWDIMAQERGSLEARMYEGIKNYLHQRQQHKKKTSADSPFLLPKKLSSKKKYTSIHVVQDPQNVPNKLLKDLLQLRTHPALTRKNRLPQQLSEKVKRSSKQQRSSPVILDEKVVIPVVEKLVMLLSHSNIIDHIECAVLTCKVASALCNTCQFPLVAVQSSISDRLLSQLKMLLSPNINVWVSLALTCLIKDFISMEHGFHWETHGGQDVCSNASVVAASTSSLTVSEASQSGVTPTIDSFEALPEEIIDSKADAELLDGLEGAATGIASSLANNLMKLIKERTPGTTVKSDPKESKTIRIISNLLTTSYLSNPILDGFYKVFVIAGQRRTLRDNKDIYLVLQDGLPSKQGCQDETLRWETTNGVGNNVELSKSSDFFNKAVENILMLGGNELECLEFFIILLDHALSKRAELSNHTISAFKNWLLKMNFEKLFSSEFNNVVVSSALKLFSSFLQKSSYSLSGNDEILTSYSNLYLNMLQHSSEGRQHVPGLLTAPALFGEQELLTQILRNVRGDEGVIGEDKRIMLKQLLLRSLQVQSMFQDQSSLKTLLLLIMDCQVPIHGCAEKEHELTLAILAHVTDLLKDFVTRNSEFLNMSWHYFNDKQVVFLLNKGDTMSAGKFGEDARIKQCNLYVNLLESLMWHEFPAETPSCQKLKCPCRSSYQALFSNLVLSLNVFTSRHLLDSKDGVNQLLFQIPHTSKRYPLGIHALGERLFDLLYLFRSCTSCKEYILHAFVGCIRQQMDVEKQGGCIIISDPLKYIVLSMLDDKAIQTFFNLDGLSLIQHCLSSQQCSSRVQAPSLIIRRMLLRNQDRSLGVMSEKVESRKRLNGHDVENFAPCAKISGPPQCTPAEILLQAKSRHQRLRFAAWSYQYQETDNSWISLTIEVPFVILLHEIVIKMHPSFLGGCPSQTIVEVAGAGSKLLPHSPCLLTSGLSVIYIEFAKETLAKVVRLRFKRPVDSDSIRLNLIELYGIAALSEEPTALSMWSDAELYPGVEILQHIFTESPPSFDNLMCSQEQAKELAKSLIQMLERTSSASSQRMICSIIGKLLSSLGEYVFEMVEYILAQDRSEKDITVIDHEAECKILYQVFRYTGGGLRVKYLQHLLRWIRSLLLRTEDAEDSLYSSRMTGRLNMVSALIFLAVTEDEDLQLSCPDGLIRKLKDISHQTADQPHVFESLASLTCALLSGAPDQWSELYEHYKSLEFTDVLYSPHASDISFITMSSLSSRTSSILVDTHIPEHLLHELRMILDSCHAATVSTDVLMTKLLKVLKHLILCARSPIFVDQFGFRDRTKLWKDLVIFVCSQCCVTRNSMKGPSLKDLHCVQTYALTLLRTLLCSSEEQQRYFVHLLLTVISSNDLLVNHMLSSSFMKYVMLQLIIQEEEVTVIVGRNSGRSSSDLTGGFCPETVADLVNYLDQRVYLKMKLSEPLSLITKALLNTKESETPKKEESPPTKGIENSTQELDGYADTNLGGIALMFSSAKSAMDKRLLKGDEKSERVHDDVDINGIGLQFFCHKISDKPLPADLTIGQIIYKHLEIGETLFRTQSLAITYEPVQVKSGDNSINEQTKENFTLTQTVPTLLHIFASEGGLAVLARQMAKYMTDRGEDVSPNTISIILKLLPLNGFANVLLQERKKAEYLLRLMLGVEENSDGDPIAASNFESELHLLPFVSLKHLLDSECLIAPNGRSLRKDAFDQGVFVMILDQLTLLSHCEKVLNGKEKRTRKTRTGSDAGPSYWAKGTGFGTGSTASTWDVEKAIQEKKKEEEHIVCLLQVITSYFDLGQNIYTTEWSEENDEALPDGLADVVRESTLIPLLSGYLRNDSVLDMANHIPLYHSVMEVLRALSSFRCLHSLLLLNNADDEGGRSETANQLLMRLQSCVDTYMERLKAMKTSRKGEAKVKKSTKQHKEPKRKEISKPTEPESEELSILIKDITDTANIVRKRKEEFTALDDLARTSSGQGNGDAEDSKENFTSSQYIGSEEKYVSEIMKLQFDTYEIVGSTEDDKIIFNVPYHFASPVRSAISSGAGSPMRSRRLAQEVASLSTSLPISYGSSVIMRCDDSRLDVMKVLITGPEDTPYANACFEFDIFFPTDYPASPVMVNLQTTGQHSVRFNPNLYNDGKVCLSILNTWHGRPEEKWNPTTSNLLQVLVSIQSLILVPEPYFNEPGYERMRSTPFGQQNSFAYNANIRQAAVRWGMIEQLRKPSPCFTEVIQRHFLLKKDEVLRQCEQWLAEMKEQATVKKSNAVHYEALKNHYWTLKNELEKLEQGRLQVDIPSTSKENNPPSQSLSAVSDYDADVYADLELGGPVAYL